MRITALRIRIGFIAAPDPAFWVNADPGPKPWFWLQQTEKNNSWKTNLFFLSKIAIYLSIDLYKGRQNYVQKKPSALKREHPALQNINFFT